jgi:hypothetical protein
VYIAVFIYIELILLISIHLTALVSCACKCFIQLLHTVEHDCSCILLIYYITVLFVRCVLGMGLMVMEALDIQLARISGATSVHSALSLGRRNV